MASTVKKCVGQFNSEHMNHSMDNIPIVEISPFGQIINARTLAN